MLKVKGLSIEFRSSIICIDNLYQCMELHVYSKRLVSNKPV